MGRKLRVDYDGACQHIIVKGIDSNYIFQEDFVKKEFIKRLLKYKEKHGVKLFAYCLMDNHIHLFTQSGASKSDNRLCISEFMRDVLSSFVRWYNPLKKRTGPLFNNRFKSFICKSTPYFIYLIDYIHRNPYAAGKTKTYHYKHSSFNNFLTGKGICDLEVCFEHIGMSRETVLAHLDARMATDEMPFLDKILEKIKDDVHHPSIKSILTSFEFNLKDFQGTGIACYFKRIRKHMIKALKDDRNLTVSSIAHLFKVSKTYIYSVINSA